MASGLELAVLDAADVPQGAGPIVTATRWTQTVRLNRGGEIAFAGVPIAEATDVELLTIDRPQVVATAERHGELYDAGAGYVTGVDLVVDTDTATTTVSATGLDLCEELTWRTLPHTDLNTAGDPVANAPALLMAYAPAGWTLDATSYQSTVSTTSTSTTLASVTLISNWREGDAIAGTGIPTGATVTDVDVGASTLTISAPATATASGIAVSRPVYLQYNGETLLDALNKLAQKLGENWRREDRTIVWLYRVQEASGLRAVGSINPDDAAGADEICLITAPLRTTRKTTTYTRISPTGGGSGTAALTLASCTRTPPAGYTLDTVNNYIAYTAYDSARRIDHDQTYSDIAVAGTDATHAASAANQLYDVALRDLQDHLVPQYTYAFGVTKLDSALAVGTTIHTEYEEYADGVQTFSLDRDLMVMESKPTLDVNGEVLSVALVVSTIAREVLTDAERVTQVVRSVQSQQRHAQPTEYAATVGDSQVAYLDIDQAWTAHQRYTGLTPGIAAGSAAGTSPTIAIHGNDEGGYIDLTTGTAPLAASAVVCTVTFNVAFVTAPKSIRIDGANAAAAALSGTAKVFVLTSGLTASVFVVRVGATALTASTQYLFWYGIKN